MIRVAVGLNQNSYDVLIGAGLIADAVANIGAMARDGRFVVVTDENVARDVLPKLNDAFKAAAITLKVITLPPGEATKSWTVLASLCDQLLAHGVERSDAIIALGGGVIGDLVGFAAAILKRGCRFIQIPTTLLAQVDSSVGGKTAINTTAGKNLIGSFHQPALVLIDPDVLSTLPIRERRAGYAEVVKYGLINDLPFFDWCEANGADVIAGQSDTLLYAISKSVQAKAHIVAADERETKDVRALLNLGHTFGHALEAEHGYSDKLLHGEAVGAGMAMAFGYSARIGKCEQNVADRVIAHLASVGLPTSVAAAGLETCGQTLVDHMLHDKKMSGGTLPFILATGIGQAYLDRDVALSDVAAFLDR